MAQRARTDFVRLALIEGVVIAVGLGLIGLVAVVACYLDPGLNPTSWHR